LSARGVSEEENRESRALQEVFENAASKPELLTYKTLTGFLGYAQAPTDMALAAKSVESGQLAPTLAYGETLLSDQYSFSSKDSSVNQTENILVNHFENGLSNHSFVLGGTGDKS